MADDADDSVNLAQLLQTLTKSGHQLNSREERAVRIIVPWIEARLRRKAREFISNSPYSPVLCMCTSDGWSAKVATSTTECIGPH
eukprot:2165740-Pyramimonas_sp.AAC.1